MGWGKEYEIITIIMITSILRSYYIPGTFSFLCVFHFHCSLFKKLYCAYPTATESETQHLSNVSKNTLRSIDRDVIETQAYNL